MKRIILLAAIAVSMLSCTDAEWAKNTNYGENFKVEMYSGGKLVREWVSSGKVNSEPKSDGYYFKEKGTNKLVEVSGDVVITNLE